MLNQRVRYLLEPGEPLTLPRHTLPQVFRAGLAVQTLGCEIEDLIISPVVAVPFPKYRDDAPLRGTMSITPGALRYPFMWLPPALRERYELAGPDGETTLESDQVWALRVALEMFTTGAFNAKTGGWVDVLGLYDIDIEDPATERRVQAWWEGADDPVLDAIDLTEMFEVDDEDEADWAILSASQLEPVFRNAAYSLAAFDLLGMCDLVEEGNTSALGGNSVTESIPLLVDIARAEFIDSPDISEALGSISHRSRGGFGSGSEAIRAIMPQLREVLATVGEAYLPDLQGVVSAPVSSEVDPRTGETVEPGATSGRRRAEDPDKEDQA